MTKTDEDSYLQASRGQCERGRITQNRMGFQGQEERRRKPSGICDGVLALREKRSAYDSTQRVGIFKIPSRVAPQEFISCPGKIICRGRSFYFIIFKEDFL